MAVDPSVVALIAREMFEGCMFTTTHTHAINKSDLLTDEEKKSYLRGLYASIAIGFLAGLIISLAVGFSFAAALDQIAESKWGIELGEGLSKIIAGIFVVDLCLKTPKWLGISNYVSRDNEIQVTNKGMMSASLFWNILRETAEAGILTSIAVLLASHSASVTVASVAAGLCAAIIGGTLVYLGVKYVNRLGSALIATVILMMLATGLIVGAVHEFEEAHHHRTGADTSEILYETEGNTKVTIKAFAWCGIQYELTVAVLIVWIFTVVGLCSAQVWNNYLGYDLFPCAKHFEFSKHTRGRRNTNEAGGDPGDGEDNNVIRLN